MCRIFGIIAKSRVHDQFLDKISQISRSLEHGGPDSSGHYISPTTNLVLGHRRLSIIDTNLSGSQPMRDRSGSVMISFNGEIYNFEKLRDQLIQKGYQFGSLTDTEVILNAYLEWGSDSFSMLNGMFAFALYDFRTEQLYLVRDPQGIKPLYIYQNNDCIAFCSEVLPLKLFGLPLSENPDWKSLFLIFGHLPAPHTTFKEVQALSKGTYLVIDHKELNCKKIPFEYRSIHVSNLTNFETAKEVLKVEFEKAVHRQMRSDVPVGVFLSGGLDSSIIAALASQHTHAEKLRTLSVNFDDASLDETIYQKLMVKKINSDHSNVFLDKKTFLADFDHICRSFDQPSIDGINTWFVSKLAKQIGLKVVLSGVGADEFFGGYSTFKQSALLQYGQIVQIDKFKSFHKIKDHRLKKLSYLRLKSNLKQYLVNRSCYDVSSVSKLTGTSESAIWQLICTMDDALLDTEESYFEKIRQLEIHQYMENRLLKDSDFMSMRHSLELRIPFLDLEFLQSVNQISLSVFAQQANPKSLLIEAFKHLLPHEICQRSKKGFILPFAAWMRNSPLTQASLNSSNSHIRYLAQQFENNKLDWGRYWNLYLMENFNSSNSIAF